MQIGEIFSRNIDRDIKEVIKVDDRSSILEEIEEYVPTEHIADELIEALDVFQETILKPSEDINMWVSGFFGSGKSSFAKIFGYLLANPSVDGVSVADRFFELNDIPTAKSLLENIHTQAPTETVLLDLNTSPNVLEEGEPIVLPIYRTLLHEFDYSRDVTIAELEFYLEEHQKLEEFVRRFEEIYEKPWRSQRDVNLAKNPASRVLHELDPETYPSADSYSNSAERPTITAKWFVSRALEMMKRRRPEKKRLVLIVDEVGQYVSRSTDRMRHLQGLAEECGKTKGTVWLVATAQEKLTDVIDSLEGKQTELAKAQDRFSMRIDLLPSDIDEVTGKRILEKTAAGAKRVRELLEADRNKVATSVALQSDRHRPFSEADFVRLYPLVPYQLQVLIDAVSARRNQGGMPQTMGGSSRTLIRHAQQLLSNSSLGLATRPVGELVTLDRSYLLLEDVIPTAWQHEVNQVAQAHGDESLDAKIMRVIALCMDVPGVPLTARNIAVVLHPSMSAEPIEKDVREALIRLTKEDRVRETDDGYRLQNPEQKDWEKTRRGIDMKLGEAVRLRKQILKDSLGSTTVTKGRTFKLELFVEGEKMADGDIALDIRAESDVESIRQTSRNSEGRNRIFWQYSVVDDTWEALKELHRSLEMIARYDNPSQTDAQRVLLAEERKRRDRGLRAAEQLLTRDVTAGSVIFDGSQSDAPDGDLKAAAQRAVTGLLDKIYPSLDTFAALFKKAEVLQILQADSLDGLPPQCGPDGLGLYRVTSTGRELVVDSGPIEVVHSYIQARKQYGEDLNGAQLERHFGGPPYGAPVEALQAVLAAAMRAGLIEVVSQSARITSATDRRLEQVFGVIPKFRAASFKPAEDDGIPLPVRAEVSEWLANVTGEPQSLDQQELADAARQAFASLRQPCIEARSTLAGAALAVPDALVTMDELLGRIASDDDNLVITTVHERRADLESGRTAVAALAAVVEENIDVLRAATRALSKSASIAGPESGADAAELRELLERARYDQDLASIRRLTSSLEDAVEDEKAELATLLNEAVDDAVSRLRTRYPAVPDEVFEGAAVPLQQLLTASEIPLMRANVAAVSGTESAVAEALDAHATTRVVRHVRIIDVWSAPITTVEELDAALARIREAVLSQLDDDSEVRLR